MGFPGGAVDRNPPTNTEDTGLTLSRKIPHTREQLSLGATAAEPVFQSLRAAAREATESKAWKRRVTPAHHN